MVLDLAAVDALGCDYINLVRFFVNFHCILSGAMFPYKGLAWYDYHIGVGSNVVCSP